MTGGLDRRDLLKILTASALAGPLQLTAAEPEKPLFFSKEEFAMLDALAEHIIPRDSHSAGARDAGVAAYIDRTTAEAFLPEEKESWRKGLTEIDRLAMEQSKKPFLKMNKDSQIDLLKQLASAESDPQSAGEKFFTQLKGSVVFAYYSSDIGIHKDIEYKGNVIQVTFAGYDAV